MFLRHPLWGGHSCPPPLTSILILKIRTFKTKFKIKGGGQECPPHTGKQGRLLGVLEVETRRDLLSDSVFNNRLVRFAVANNRNQLRSKRRINVYRLLILFQ